MTTKKEENGQEQTPKVWDGIQLVELETYMESVSNDIPTPVGSQRKEAVAKSILVGLFEGHHHVAPAEYERISKICKQAEGISSGPSLNWMIENGYMNRVKVPNKRAFYMITEKGIDFAKLVGEPEAEVEVSEPLTVKTIEELKLEEPSEE